MSKKIIIGLVGQIACGKDTAVDYLVKTYGAGTHRFSESMFDCVIRLGLETTRENLVAFSEITRTQFGQDLFANIIVKDCLGDPNEIIIANGIRRMPDIEGLGKLDGFHLIHITAPARTRHERIIQRGEKDCEKDLTWEQFQEQALLPTETSIKEVANHAKHIVDNSGSFEDLYRQLDELMTKLQA